TPPSRSKLKKAPTSTPQCATPCCTCCAKGAPADASAAPTSSPACSRSRFPSFSHWHFILKKFSPKSFSSSAPPLFSPQYSPQAPAADCFPPFSVCSSWRCSQSGVPQRQFQPPPSPSCCLPFPSRRRTTSPADGSVA